MLTFLSALVPSLAGLVVAAWIVLEQIHRRREKQTRISLQPERQRLFDAALAEAHDHPPVDYDALRSRSEQDYRTLLEISGISRSRAKRSVTLAEDTVETEVGATLPTAEVIRQLILLFGATAGIVLLAVAEITGEV